MAAEDGDRVLDPPQAAAHGHSGAGRGDLQLAGAADEGPTRKAVATSGTRDGAGPSRSSRGCNSGAAGPRRGTGPARGSGASFPASPAPNCAARCKQSSGTSGSGNAGASDGPCAGAMSGASPGPAGCAGASTGPDPGPICAASYGASSSRSSAARPGRSPAPGPRRSFVASPGHGAAVGPRCSDDIGSGGPGGIRGPDGPGGPGVPSAITSRSFGSRADSAVSSPSSCFVASAWSGPSRIYSCTCSSPRRSAIAGSPAGGSKGSPFGYPQAPSGGGSRCCKASHGRAS